MRSVVLATSLLVASCATHPAPPALSAAEPACPPPGIASTPLSAPVTGSVRFVPRGAAAERYNDPMPAGSHAPLADAVVAAVRDAAARAGRPAPEPDERLFRACTDLAEIAPELRGAAIALDDRVVAFALQRNGIIEPAVRLLFGWGDMATPERFVRELQPALASELRAGGAARLGVGVARGRADGTAAIVLALQGSAVSTMPIPREVPPDGDIVIDAVLDERFRDPEVFVTHPGGDTRQVDVQRGRPGGFVAQIACRARDGRQQIEITASDAAGPAVLANFPVWCAAAPPAALPVERATDDPVTTPAQAEQALLAAIDRDRAAAGLPALHRDAALAAVARAHAEDMRGMGAVSHVSPTTGTAVDRVRDAGIATRLVLENVARGHGVGEAHRALMNSPGHRASLLSADATDVGVGVAIGEDGAGRRELFIAQLFARAPHGARVIRDPAAGRERARCDRAAP